MSIECGQTADQLFFNPTDSAALAQGESTICGVRSYTVKRIVGGVDTNQTWFTVTSTSVANEKKLTGTTSAEADQGVHNMVMITSLPTTQGNAVYPTMRTLFTFTVLPATCDCTLLNWDIPTKTTLNVKLTKTPTTQLAMATVNEASKTAVPAIRSCVGALTCDMTSPISLVEKSLLVLPNFVTFNNDVASRILSLAPTVSNQMTTTNPNKPKYTLTMT